MHLLTQFTPHPPAAAPVHQSGMHHVASLLSREEENPPPAAALRNDSVRKLVVLCWPTGSFVDAQGFKSGMPAFEQ